MYSGDYFWKFSLIEMLHIQKKSENIGTYTKKKDLSVFDTKKYRFI